MADIETKKKLRDALKGIEKAKKSISEEEESNLEATKLAVSTQTLAEMEDMKIEMSTLKDTIVESNKNTVEAIKDINVDVFPEAPVVPEANVNVTMPEMPKIDVPEPKVTVNVPDVIVPPINVPEPKVTVNVEKPDAPIVNIPDFPEQMSVDVMNDRGNPIPMTPVDLDGKPMDFGGTATGGARIGKVNVLDKHGQVITPSAGEYIDEQNSSSGPLASGASFTGQWVDTNGYSSVKVAVTTDQNGSYTIQWSPDGTNADSTLTRYYRTTQIEAPHKFENMRKYMRVVYTNDSATDQTYFRLQTILSNSAAILNIPLDGTMAQDYDAISTRPTDFHTEVALSRRQGATTWNKFGYNEDVDTSTDPEIVASWGGTFSYITTGETIDIVSTSTNDDADPATGAQQVIIWGVDENWDEQTEVVVMDGTSTTTTTSQWIGINRVSVFKAGTGLKNDGTINVTTTDTGTQLAQMPVGEGTTQQLIFYVPQNHQFLASWLYFNAIKSSGGSNPEVLFKGLVYSDVATAEFEVYRDTVDTSDNTHAQLNPAEPFIIGEKSILWFTAETSGNDTSVRGRFSGKLIRDADA